MQKLPLALSAAVVSLFGLSNTATAATITFDLSGTPSTQDSFVFEEGGVSLTVTGSNSKGVDADVFRSPLGLGVRSDTFLDTPKLDGLSGDETLSLAFDRPIVPEFALFTFVDRNDDVTINLDGATLFEDAPVGTTSPNFNLFGIAAIGFETTETGSVLSFTATQRNDQFLLKKVEVGAVPEPLTILGSAAALGLGGALRRKFAR